MAKLLSNDYDANPRCTICGNTHQFKRTRTTLLNTFSTDLIHCQSCDFEWLSGATAWIDIAYQKPIANTDTGIVRRNMELHPILSTFLMLGNSSKYLEGKKKWTELHESLKIACKNTYF